MIIVHYAQLTIVDYFHIHFRFVFAFFILFFWPSQVFTNQFVELLIVFGEEFS